MNVIRGIYPERIRKAVAVLAGQAMVLKRWVAGLVSRESDWHKPWAWHKGNHGYFFDEWPWPIDLWPTWWGVAIAKMVLVHSAACSASSLSGGVLFLDDRYTHLLTVVYRDRT